MISGGSQRRAGASGPANVALTANGDGIPMYGSTVGVATITRDFLGNVSNTFDATGCGSIVLAMDGGSSGTANIQNSSGPISFTGTFTGLSITLINCAQLPTIPIGCISYYLIGTTSTTTLVSSTVLPHAISVEESSSSITAVNFSAGSSIENSDVVNWIFTNVAALDVSSVNAILAFCVAHGGDGGTLVLTGGCAAPSGQGILDVATLIASGWTVTTN